MVEPLQEPEQYSSRYYEIDSRRTTSKKEGKKRRQIADDTAFHDMMCKVPSSLKFTDMCKIRPNESSAEDYTSVFLGHAQLYVLTEKWNIKPLKVLVLHKLHTILREYTPYEARYDDVVELIRYTYENTPSRKRLDELRRLVTEYVAYDTIQIAKAESCLLLIKEGGSFARNLMSMVLEKVE